MRRRNIVGRTFWIIALCAVGLPLRAAAQAHHALPVRVEVDSVLAGDGHGGRQSMDHRLGASTRCRLKTVFDYTSYRLVKHEEAGTESGQPVAFNLPGGRILHVAPLGVEGNMIAMELVLFVGARAIMRPELKMMRGGALILVGPRSPRATYITTISIQSLGVAKEIPSARCDSGPSLPADLPSSLPPQ
jgi:hypothetical protein